MKDNFKKHPEALYDFYVARKGLPDELRGTDFHTWDSNQISLFCGLPINDLQSGAVIAITNVVSTGEGNTVHKQLPSKMEAQEVQGNENETIGF